MAARTPRNEPLAMPEIQNKISRAFKKSRASASAVTEPKMPCNVPAGSILEKNTERDIKNKCNKDIKQREDFAFSAWPSESRCAL